MTNILRQTARLSRRLGDNLFRLYCERNFSEGGMPKKKSKGAGSDTKAVASQGTGDDSPVLQTSGNTITIKILAKPGAKHNAITGHWLFHVQVQCIYTYNAKFPGITCLLLACPVSCFAWDVSQSKLLALSHSQRRRLNVQRRLTMTEVQGRNSEKAGSACSTLSVRKLISKGRGRVGSSRPTFKQMIAEAVRDMKSRQGSSRQAIIKYVRARYNPRNLTEKQFKTLFNKALRVGVQQGNFQQVKGVGAVGSFRLGGEVKKTGGGEAQKSLGKADKSGARTASVHKVAMRRSRSQGGDDQARQRAKRYKLGDAGRRLAATMTRTPQGAKTAHRMSRLDTPRRNKAPTSRASKTTKGKNAARRGSKGTTAHKFQAKKFRLIEEKGRGRGSGKSTPGRGRKPTPPPPTTSVSNEFAGEDTAEPSSSKPSGLLSSESEGSVSKVYQSSDTCFSGNPQKTAFTYNKDIWGLARK